MNREIYPKGGNELLGKETAGIRPPRAVNTRQAIDAYLLVLENQDRTAETIILRRCALNKTAAEAETEPRTEGHVVRALALGLQSQIVAPCEGVYRTSPNSVSPGAPA